MISRLICALILVALAGPHHPLAAATQSSAANQSKAQNQPRSPADAQIERTIQNKLAKSKMSGDHFTVSVVKGVATIEGATNVMQHKGAMTRMAKTSGATSVRNNIRISDAAKNKAVASLAKGRTGQLASPSAPVAATGNTSATPPPIPRATVLPAAPH